MTQDIPEMTDNVKATNNKIEDIFPDHKTVSVRVKGGLTEIVEIHALPLGKWKQTFRYVAQIAPLLGFGGDDMQQAVSDTATAVTDAVAAGSDEVLELDAMALPSNLNDRIWQILQSEASDIILDFVAFAIDRDRDFIDNVHEEIIDIIVAIVEVNLVFFVQKLLPKVLTGTKEVTALAAKIRPATASK